MSCGTCARKTAYGSCDGGVMHYVSGDFICPALPNGGTLVVGTGRPVPELTSHIPTIPSDPVDMTGLEDLI